MICYLTFINCVGKYFVITYSIVKLYELQYYYYFNLQILCIIHRILFGTRTNCLVLLFIIIMTHIYYKNLYQDN